MARDVILARRAAFIAAALAAAASSCTSESNPQPCLSLGGYAGMDSGTGGSAGADAAPDVTNAGGSAGEGSDGSAP